MVGEDEECTEEHDFVFERFDHAGELVFRALSGGGGCEEWHCRFGFVVPEGPAGEEEVECCYSQRNKVESSPRRAWKTQLSENANLDVRLRPRGAYHEILKLSRREVL